MLTLDVPEVEYYSEDSGFETWPARQLRLEHSLLAVSKWETHWQKPFLVDGNSPQEINDYVRFMDLDEASSPLYYQILPADARRDIAEYIDRPNTASKVSGTNAPGIGGEYVTSELIYYWMTVHNIPFSCETWNLNRLLILIRIANAKSNPQKMSSGEAGRMQARMNRERLKAMRRH